MSQHIWLLSCELSVSGVQIVPGLFHDEIICFIVHKYGHLPSAEHANKSYDMHIADNNKERGSSVNEFNDFSQIIAFGMKDFL